ncbi:hypothetical protein REPUB_Repub07fG0187900 [Reevesia pubescens]
MQVGGTEAPYSADTVLRLDSPGSSICLRSASKGIKRKWSLMDGSISEQVGSSLSLRLGHSSSSLDSKGSSTTACTTTSSAKEADEESSMDMELDFTLHLGNEKVINPKKSASPYLKGLEFQPKIDLELSLSTGPSESDITSVHLSSSPIQRCHKPGCHKGAEGRTVYCKAHGGGRRCEFLGCTKSAEGRTDFCIAHGGGRRCSHEGCTRAARGKSGLCIRHGGGKRCQQENCTKSAEGLSGLCISHGGGRRCQFIGCTKGAQGSTMFCKAHGGGKRCTYQGCTKGAEGSTPFCKGHGGGKRCAFQGGGVCTKSVHGGTNFCVAHGGGKRCAVPECTKSARGRTNYCVRHGGGKRCKFEGCGKSAQGSTDFCKAHGGGKRCSWGHPGSEYGNQLSGPCNSFARGKSGLCALHDGLVQDKRVHGGATLGPIVQDPKFSKPGKMKEIVIAEDMNVDTMKMGSGIEASAGRTYSGFNHHGVPNVPNSVPEGRVHGGSLMAMLVGGSGLGSSNSEGLVGDPSQPSKAFIAPQSWM